MNQIPKLVSAFCSLVKKFLITDDFRFKFVFPSYSLRSPIQKSEGGSGTVEGGSAAAGVVVVVVVVAGCKKKNLNETASCLFLIQLIFAKSNHFNDNTGIPVSYIYMLHDLNNDLGIRSSDN